jgi:alkylation response protein AidB-like acyl-CoA dehydrogenase
MYIDYGDEEKSLRAEVRAYCAGLLPTGERHFSQGETRAPHDRQTIRQMGQDGWLGLSFPREYGGQGRPLLDHYIFFDEAQKAGAPISHVTLMTVAPALLSFGSLEQKREFLPRIMTGEILFSIGYSEPEAGTDLAALRTSAVRDGDEYLINGQKYFTSGGDTSDFIWLAARTGTPDSRHEGISLFIVETANPGYSFDRIETLAPHQTNVTYYDNVRVPISRRVGEENEGWRLITTQLNLERLTMVMPSPVQALFAEVCDWARTEHRADGRRVIDVPWVQLNLARVHMKLEALKLLNWRTAWSASNEVLSPADASVMKVYGSEFQVEAYRLLLEVIGARGYLKTSAPGAVLEAKLEKAYRGATIKTFGGGVNEIQREIIARSGLGVPSTPRRLG